MFDEKLVALLKKKDEDQPGQFNFSLSVEAQSAGDARFIIDLHWFQPYGAPDGEWVYYMILLTVEEEQYVVKDRWYLSNIESCFDVINEYTGP